MRILVPAQPSAVTAERAQRVAAVLALALVVVLGAIWAKVSRYERHALPSCHFSKSVKIARGLFHSGLDEEPQALLDSAASLPEPDWAGFAPLPEQVEISGATRLPFQALRAPPIEL